MSNGDSTRQAQDLRDQATSLLHEAAQCSDPARRDGLLREAITRLEKARLLLHGLDEEAEGLGLGPTRRTH